MKNKEIDFYMGVAQGAALMSHAERKKVGAVVVTVNGGMYYGYNGTLAGLENSCETLINGELFTKETVIHAEKNCLSKMLKEGVSAKCGTMFLTLSPCVTCALMIAASGISTVYYKEKYRDESGLNILKQANIYLEEINENLCKQNQSQ